MKYCIDLGHTNRSNFIMSEREVENTNQESKVMNENKISFKQKTRIVLMTLLALFLTIFIVQNSNRVELEFLNINFRVRIIYIILFSAIIGIVLGYLFSKMRKAKK